MKRVGLSIVCLLYSTFLSFGQQKYEREYRIKEDKVPAEAKSFIRDIPNSNPVKWYYEESQDGESVEAKFRFRHHKVSVEFTKDGRIIDIEIKYRFAELSKSEQSAITQTLGGLYDKYRLRKIQKQYSKLSRQEFLTLFTENPIPRDYHFEIVLKGKKAKEKAMYEVLISQAGELLSVLKFAPPNSLNLEF